MLKISLAGIVLLLCSDQIQAQAGDCPYYFPMTFHTSDIFNRVTGTLQGGASLEGAVPAHPGTMCTDGVSGALDLGNLRDQCLGNLEKCPNGITLAFWLAPEFQQMSGSKEVYYLSSGGQTVSSHGLALYRRYDQLQVDASTTTEWLKTPRTNDAGFTIEAGKWYHVVLTWKEDVGLILYVDGDKVIELQSGTGQARNLESTDYNNFYLGRPNNAEDYWGKMCIESIYMWEEFLTPVEVDAKISSYNFIPTIQ